ncbi:hypothetical protein AMTR_s00190p00036840 [Amborella trichopoda]|uniref:Uncharacterized protein n=1 Tax=Amborella trichopoda TaxID=13333 RepID=U5CYN0_AMBTC|nr:hypothetical protein AMTR_s00190p00036840 [Amborella trichopoda]
MRDLQKLVMEGGEFSFAEAQFVMPLNSIVDDVEPILLLPGLGKEDLRDEGYAFVDDEEQTYADMLDDMDLSF